MTSFDMVYSGKKKSKACLLVLTERATRNQYNLKINDRTEESVIHALNRLERMLGSKTFRQTFKTITCDNGTEFGDGTALEKSCLTKGSRTQVYFCHPYSSFERGSNENNNKLIRHWIKKGDSIAAYTQKQIDDITRWMKAL